MFDKELVIEILNQVLSATNKVIVPFFSFVGFSQFVSS